jgi:hypothetical protein
MYVRLVYRWNEDHLKFKEIKLFDFVKILDENGIESSWNPPSLKVKIINIKEISK